MNDADAMRRVAVLMREQHGPDHPRHEMWEAMADWMDEAVSFIDDGFGIPICARAVARAYLKATP